jgi:GTP-binding protein EngB required for normal cell division
MNNFFQKDSANYERKINKIIEMLQAESAYLQQLNEKMDKLSDEWQSIKKSMTRRLENDTQETLKINNYNIDKNIGNDSTEKEMEDLILCIVKEVNNYHIEFICLN